MSSPEVEKFEISERDWDDAVNIAQGRGPRRISKNKALYGVWADSGDSDDDVGYKTKKTKGGYSAPMAFVSGGVKHGDKITRNIENSEDDDNSAAVSEKQTKPPANYSKAKKHKRSDGVFVSKDNDFGKWEKHTKGIGQKLLSKMGYKAGEGLGVRSQGITTPVEAHKRKNTKAAIAYHGSERPVLSIPVEEDEDDTTTPHVQQWRKHDQGTKKVHYQFRTVQEVIDSGVRRKNITDAGEASKVKVIDMTGREQKILSGYRSISKRPDCPDDVLDNQALDEDRAFDVPELTHNLDLLLDMAEEEIILNDRKIKHGQDRLVNIQYERQRLDELCRQEETQVARMKKIIDIVESCEARLKVDCENPLTMDEAIQIFQTLQDECYEEYKLYDLSSLSIVIVFPLMKRYLAMWSPLQQPLFCIDVFRQWRYLIEDVSKQFSQDPTTTDPYQRLIWDIWMPPVRTAILKCDIRKCDPVISLIEHWMPLVPGWILANILSQLIMPHLIQEVDKWNPLTDTVPIHAWLQPWMPLIGERLVPLYAPIRHKLANALTNWHPSDASAKLILQPWVGVFKAGQMEAFVVKNIFPKLTVCMQNFSINPHTQLLDPWNWVMSWCDFIPIDNMVSMLEKTFFPRWHQVLISWLTSQPNYDEVRNWYLGWKSLIPEKLLNHPTVKDHLGKALDIMNRAVTGKLSSSPADNAVLLRDEPRPDRREIIVTPKTTSSSTPFCFKDLIQRRAEENSLLFMPMAGKTHEAKQVYRFGCKQVYLDRNVVFMYDNHKWIPVSLQSLVDSAR